MPTCPACGEDNPDRARFCLSCGIPLGPSDEGRRPVTALFCDLVGSTELGERFDAEVVRRVFDRYHELMRTAVERHGGTVEKFIGDAVVGVFGVPIVHEDDALRAVKAALEMRDAIPGLRSALGLELDIRIGLQSGEVVADLATTVQGGIGSDVFNTAARLQAAARAGTVVVGRETAELLKGRTGRVLLAPLDGLQLKGKADQVPAFEVRGLVQERTSGDRPLVGRDRQLELLRRAFEDAIEAGAPVLVTVLAPPGVGKSRLGRAFTEEVEADATVLVGQTPSYGEGVTFAPLVEILTHASGSRTGEAGAVADRIREQLATQADGGTVAARLAQLLGVGESTGSDTAWAVRRFLETLALEGPLVLIVDDAHAAEEPMLDLLDALVDRLHAPALVLCLARPELLESKPSWGGGKQRAATMSLPPLTEDESRALAVALLGADTPPPVVEQVCERSEGNPLYLEQLVAALEDQGLIGEGRWVGGTDGELEIPSTIQALLAARLDRLDAETRRILELASVEGRRFHLDAVRALADGARGGDIRTTLEALESRGFVDQEDPLGAAWRFSHVLIQEAAYRRLSKAGRAELHESLARWVESDLAGHPDADETIGRHLEVALGYRQELLLGEEGSAELARRAGERFASAGERAFARLDLTSSAVLLQRAANLLPRTALARLELLPQLGVALMEVGRAHDAEALLTDAVEAARSVGAEAEAVRAEIQLVTARAVYGASTDEEIVGHVAAVERARAALEEAGHEAGLAEAWIAIDYLEFMRGRTARMLEADRAALRHGLASGRMREAFQAGADLMYGAALGPMPFSGVREIAEELAAATDPISRVTGLAGLAAADLAEGNIAFAERERERVEMVERHGLGWLGAALHIPLAHVEAQLGLPERVEQRMTEARQVVLATGDLWWLNAIDPLAGLAAYAQGRTRDFLRIADAFEAEMQVFDREARTRRQLLRALSSLSRGALAEAEASAKTALELTEPTDLETTKADVLTALGDIAAARGFHEQAATYRAAAAATHERRGNVAAIAALEARAGIDPGRPAR